LPVGILSGQLLFAAAGRRDAWGLIGGTVCGQFAVAAGLGLHLWVRDQATIRALSWRGLMAAASIYRNYPLYMTPYTLVGLTRERLAYFLLGRMGTTAAAGYYNLVARLINLPNSFVSSALRPVFFQHAAGQDPRSLELPMLETIRTLGLVSVLLYAPCVAQAAWLFGLVFGPAWIPAAPYAIVLSLPAIPLLMGNWADRMFDVLGRQRTALKLEVVFSLIAMAGLLGGYWVFRDLLSAVIVQSLLLTLYFSVWLCALFRVAGYGLGQLARYMVQVAAVGAIAVCCCLLAGRLLPAPLAFPSTMAVAAVVAAILTRRGWRRLGNFLGR
jgi:O-antigen/teichoic acid export membrane protein